MAIADAPTPVPGRASDADRRRIARALQEHSTQGRLSRDTYAARVERALTARSQAELDDLVADVRQPGPLRRATLAAVRWTSTLSADIRSAWEAGRIPTLALPASSAHPTTLGRSIDCDCVVVPVSTTGAFVFGGKSTPTFAERMTFLIFVCSSIVIGY